MKNIITFLATCLLALSANALTSTINPAVPAQNATLSSAPIRNNFLSAYNDINSIYGILSGISGLTPGGLNGQIQYNNGAGGFGAFTANGDCTITVTSGAIICLSTNGNAFAQSATTDTTNATNITSGTLPAAQIPNPSASTLGGVESISASSHNFLTSISTSGVPAQAQPAFTDISGSLATAQLPALASANLWVGNGSNAATAVSLSGDCGISNAGSITCTKSSGTLFGTAAFVNTGVSGAVIPLLNANNVYSGTANFTNTFSIGGTAETFPASGLIVGTTDSQTLTNKSIAASEINSGVLSSARMPTLVNFSSSVTALSSFGGL